MTHHPGSLIDFKGQHGLMRGKTHTFWEKPGLRAIGGATLGATLSAKLEFIITGQLPRNLS
jgi:hypothetical protein